MTKNVKMVIVCRKDLSMRKGKLAAQVGHASLKFLLESNESNRIDELKIKLTYNEALWLSTGQTKVVVSVDSEDELRDLMFHAETKGIPFHSITDAGKTEFHGNPTMTCCAFGPAEDSDIDEVTGKLKLL